MEEKVPKPIRLQAMDAILKGMLVRLWDANKCKVDSWEKIP